MVLDRLLGLKNGSSVISSVCVCVPAGFLNACRLLFASTLPDAEGLVRSMYFS